MYLFTRKQIYLKNTLGEMCFFYTIAKIQILWKSPMAVNNHYIQKVLDHPYILTQQEHIYAHKGNWSSFFWNTSPIVLEIGTGMGNFFSKMIWENPEKNHIGMEIRYKRLYTTAEKWREKSSEDPHFIVIKDFAQNIDKIFEQQEIQETYIFFPDPWAKKERQKKHRLMQGDFLEHLYQITKPGGKLYFKTDHREYFDATQAIIEKQKLWNIETISHEYQKEEIFTTKNITEFEAHYRGSDVPICYLECSKN